MIATTAPKDQRAKVRPISFVLDAPSGFRTVTLPIRPEDLTRTEPSRSTVHQTMGRDVKGWVDDFGAGLPSVTISGHTGWRTPAGGKYDGFGSFEDLNNLVVKEYNSAKQSAIDGGRDPAKVRLLFVDGLDNFAWAVQPMQFVLRRSKSRPLLFQYNIVLQAVSASVDDVSRFFPAAGSISSGLTALDVALGVISDLAGDVQGLVASAVAYVDRALAPIGATVKKFVDVSYKVFSAASSINSGITSVANSLIRVASDIAQVGANVFRTIAALQNVPYTLKAQIGRVASAYSEIFCLFNNSLRARRTYEEYSGLYGASNCSSTTGGRPASGYASSNVFELLKTDRATVSATSPALSSILTVARADPVLNPIPVPELGRHLGNITSGVFA